MKLPKTDFELTTRAQYFGVSCHQASSWPPTAMLYSSNEQVECHHRCGTVSNWPGFCKHVLTGRPGTRWRWISQVQGQPPSISLRFAYGKPGFCSSLVSADSSDGGARNHSFRPKICAIHATPWKCMPCPVDRPSNANTLKSFSVLFGGVYPGAKSRKKTCPPL